MTLQEWDEKIKAVEREIAERQAYLEDLKRARKAQEERVPWHREKP